MHPKPDKAAKIHKKDLEGWCTDDLEFDEDGTLYIKNEELARAIEANRNARVNKQLYMSRDLFEEEQTGDGGGTEGPKANMLCPCEPSGP